MAKRKAKKRRARFMTKDEMRDLAYFIAGALRRPVRKKKRI